MQQSTWRYVSCTFTSGCCSPSCNCIWWPAGCHAELVVSLLWQIEASHHSLSINSLVTGDHIRFPFTAAPGSIHSHCDIFPQRVESIPRLPILQTRQNIIYCYHNIYWRCVKHCNLINEVISCFEWHECGPCISVIKVGFVSQPRISCMKRMWVHTLEPNCCLRTLMFQRCVSFVLFLEEEVIDLRLVW